MSNVVHPDYYNGGVIEAWDYIKDHNMDFDIGNAIKYLTRAGKKSGNPKREDLEKAIQYIQHEIMYEAVRNPESDTEETVWCARQDGTSADFYLEHSDIELCRDKVDGSYSLYIELGYKFNDNDEVVDYLNTLKELFANYIINHDDSDYEITYTDEVGLDIICGETPTEVYEKFAFFVDSFANYVCD